jgi:hypothetical protein
MTAKHGTWFVLRARGKSPHRPDPSLTLPNWQASQGSERIAFSGAVYVHVDGQSFWKPSAVPSIVQDLKQGLAKLTAPETSEEEEWDLRETTQRLWDSQKELLKQRVDHVMPIYDQLILRARMAIGNGKGSPDRSNGH